METSTKKGGLYFVSKKPEFFDIDDVIRHITGYSKIPNRHGSFLAEVEYEFAKLIPLSFLQDLFGIPRDHPDEGYRYMIDCFHIDKEKADALQPFVKEKLDLDKYSFSLDCSEKTSYLKWKENQGNVEPTITHDDLIRFIDAHPEEPDENGELRSVRFELQKPIAIEFLNELFHVDPNDEEVFWGDELNEEHAKALQPYFKEKLDTERYLLILTAKRKTVEEKK